MQEVSEAVSQDLEGKLWIPQPGPQTEAYFSEADEIFYGGSAGGGKTDLGLGLMLNEHTRSLFLRRERNDAKEVLDRVENIVGTGQGRNSQDLIWRINDKLLRFAGCKDEKDKQKHKGKPYDFYFFDEVSDFTLSQYMFIQTWNRSTKPGQRCRVVAAGNPPTTAEGMWVVVRWAAWLDPKHPNPAKPGELRWYITDKNDKEYEVDGRGPHKVEHKDGSIEVLHGKSRTFIRAWLTDNKYLADTDYGARLDTLPARERLAYRDGVFHAQLEDGVNQVIPTAWLLEAQDRWQNVWKGQPPPHVPMCAIGVDIAQGGQDKTVFAPRYDGFYTELIKVPGKDTPNGASVLAELVKVRKDGALPVIDMGGGFGGATAEKLEENRIEYAKYRGAAESSAVSSCQNFVFYNKRAEAYWRFREALNPEQPGGSDIALPDSKTLLADLAALTYKTSKAEGGKMLITVLPKEIVVKNLGRSPDEGDAVVMAYSAGEKAKSHANIWHGSGRTQEPRVILGHDSKRRNRK